MKKHSDHIDSLFAKSLADTLSEQEKEALSQLLRDQPELQTELNELKAISSITNHLTTPTVEIDFQSRWDKLAEKTTQSKVRSLKNIYTIAASIAAVTIVGVAVIAWIRAGEIKISTRNAQVQKITLPDASVVTLNAASSVRYNSRMWYFTRNIHLEGEAFFSVTKTGSTFNVTTPTTVVSVLGTSFNVRQREKTSVSCFTGKVAVTLFNQTILLEKGMRCTVIKDSVVRTTFDPKDLQADWMMRRLHFDRTPLKEIFAEVQRFYDVRIVYQGNNLNTFSGTFENGNVEEVIELICFSMGLTRTKDANGTYIIK